MGVPEILRATFGGRLVGVMELSRDDRGLSLIAAPTRCIRRGDVHELIVTDERDAGPGSTVLRCRFLGFVEFECAGVLVRGDSVEVDGRAVGTVAGFDECHFPNHLNIVLQAAHARTGIQLGLRPGALLVVRPRSGNHLAGPSADKESR
jgi:L-arabinose 1-dehydrogenase